MQTRVLQDKPGERVFLLAFDKGDNPPELLTSFVGERNIRAGRLTAIGAFSEATLGYFDREKKDYVKIPIREQVEVLALTGNVAWHDGQPKVHAHVVVGKRDGTAHGGHLLEARVWPTLEVSLVESPGELRRTMDEETGLPLLQG